MDWQGFNSLAVPEKRGHTGEKAHPLAGYAFRHS